MAFKHHLAQHLRPFEESNGSRHLQLLFSAARLERQLHFAFTLAGRGEADLDVLKIQNVIPERERLRRSELWLHSCLEIFVGPMGSSSYLELNLAPSGDWNVFAFDEYRSGMREAGDARVSLASVETLAGSRTWHATLEAQGGEVELWLKAPTLEMSATAVLEYQGGLCQYWGLKHAGQKPDFHLRESFVLKI